MKTRPLRALPVVAGAYLLIRTALAGYIDPNTGGMIFQILAVIFGFLSGLVLLFAGHVRRLWARLRRLVRSEKAADAAADAAAESDIT